MTRPTKKKPSTPAVDRPVPHEGCGCHLCASLREVFSSAVEDAYEVRRLIAPDDGPSTSTSIEGSLASLVSLKRGYERDLPADDPDTVEHEHKRGIAVGLQMAVDLIRRETGLSVVDPVPPRTRRGRAAAKAKATSTAKADAAKADAARATATAEAAETDVDDEVRHHLATHVSLDKMELAILRAAAHRHPAPSSDRQLAVLAGYRQSGSFRTALASLRALEMFSSERDGSHRVNRLTPSGLARAGSVRPIERGPAMLLFWQGRLDKAEGAILGASVALTRERPGPNAVTGSITDQEIAEYCGYTQSGSFRTALASVRALGLVDRRTNRCADVFLPDRDRRTNGGE